MYEGRGIATSSANLYKMIQAKDMVKSVTEDGVAPSLRRELLKILEGFESTYRHIIAKDLEKEKREHETNGTNS